MIRRAPASALRVNGQQSVEPARVDNSGHERRLAHQTQLDAALFTTLRLFGQHRECAATHEIKPRDVDHEGAGRNDDAGAPR